MLKDMPHGLVQKFWRVALKEMQTRSKWFTNVTHDLYLGEESATELHNF